MLSVVVVIDSWIEITILLLLLLMMMMMMLLLLLMMMMMMMMLMMMMMMMIILFRIPSMDFALVSVIPGQYVSHGNFAIRCIE